MRTLKALHVPVKSSLMTCSRTGDAQGAYFEVPAKHEDQRPIFFGRVESDPNIHEYSEDDSDSPQILHYGTNSHHMMERMDYDLIGMPGLNFGKGRRTLL